MTLDYFLGIDTSTTTSKALLIDWYGEVIAVASSPHTLQTPKPLWRQILASVLEAELVTVNTSEGAALLAGVGVGAWADVPTACKQTVHVKGQTFPDSNQVNVYRRMYPLYQELYPTLKNKFAKLSTL